MLAMPGVFSVAKRLKPPRSREQWLSLHLDDNNVSLTHGTEMLGGKSCPDQLVCRYFHVVSQDPSSPLLKWTRLLPSSPRHNHDLRPTDMLKPLGKVLEPSAGPEMADFFLLVENFPGACADGCRSLAKSCISQQSRLDGGAKPKCSQSPHDP